MPANGYVNRWVDVVEGGETMNTHSPSSERTSTHWVWLAVLIVSIVLALAVILHGAGGGGGGGSPVY